jgi:hypothetical protein
MGMRVYKSDNFLGWLKGWKGDTDHDWDSRIGRLHGLRDERYWRHGPEFADYREEIIDFLLGIADGHTDVFRFGDASGANLRRKLAVKAFTLLCERFFPIPFGFRKHPQFHEMSGARATSSFGERVRWFLRLQDNGCLYNDPMGDDEVSNHQTEVFRRFAFAMAQFDWSRDPSERESPFVAEMLLRSVRMFDHYDILGESLLDKVPDSNCETLLCQLSMNRKLSLPNGKGGEVDRLPDDVDEAVLGGSKAAQVLTVWRAYRKAQEPRLVL